MFKNAASSPFFRNEPVKMYEDNQEPFHRLFSKYEYGVSCNE